MGKISLLMKSNFRKNKGTSIGLLLLMLLATMIIGVSMLVFIDAYPTSGREADRLNAGDGFILLGNDTTGLDNEKIDELLGSSVEQYEFYHCMGYNNVSLPFGDGELSETIVMYDSRVFEDSKGGVSGGKAGAAIDRIEVVTEDSSITDNYMYLPYQFYTSGGINIGDDYTFEYHGTKENLKVRGFINTTYFGCNNSGIYMLVVDDVNYSKISEHDKAYADVIVINYILKDGYKASKFIIGFQNDVLGANPYTFISQNDIDTTLFSKSFMSLIIAVSLLVVILIIMIVIIMMLASCISNYVKENMKTIGALKAIGYTSSDIRKSLIGLFCFISVIGSLVGIGLSYSIMPVMAKIVVGQMGLPYTVGFNAVATIIPVVFVMVFVLILTGLATGSIKKVEPIMALRNGMETHNYKKNRVKLEKSVLNLNVSLAMKTLLTNVKQNVITFFVIGFCIFICIIGVLMYENFSRKPNLSILTFETCSGILAVDTETRAEAVEYLESYDSVSNIRFMINIFTTYNDEETLVTYVFDDTDKMNNKQVCYKGRIPKYDNEVAVSGQFAREYNLKIGDEVELTYGKEKYRYLITGYIQTCNNYGREAMISEEASMHLIEENTVGAYLWFDCSDKSQVNDILDKFADEQGAHVISTMNFDEILGANMTTFKGISTLMLVMVSCISGAIIMLVLYLLIKALIYNKRRDYGIYKALGYTSHSLMLQTALSFMPAIIVSIIVFSVGSYYGANPYMSMIMGMFGLMKCSFSIPVAGVVIVGVVMAVLAFVFAIFNSRKIKNIEPINLITAE